MVTECKKDDSTACLSKPAAGLYNVFDQVTIMSPGGWNIPAFFSSVLGLEIVVVEDRKDGAEAVWNTI
jgi:hypothetical protein